MVLRIQKYNRSNGIDLPNQSSDIKMKARCCRSQSNRCKQTRSFSKIGTSNIFSPPFDRRMQLHARARRSKIGDWHSVLLLTILHQLLRACTDIIGATSRRYPFCKRMQTRTEIRVVQRLTVSCLANARQTRIRKI